MAKSFHRKIALFAALLIVTAAVPAFPATKKKRAKAKPPAAAPASPANSVEPEEEPLPPGLKQVVPDIPPDLAELPLTARGATVIDSLTGRVLYDKNAYEAQYPASTTKIMTALLVIEAGNLDQQITVTLEDSKVGESGLEIKPGEQFTRREALYGLLLKSANDVAHALGRDNAGSIEAFAEKMNRRARDLGATNTHFANPHGLHDLQHYTSPHDLALIARTAMQQPLFRQIVSTQFHPWSAPSTGLVELRNHNRLLWGFPGCVGVKTGYTYPAQQVLVSAAEWGCREVIAVVMHSGKPGIWDDSRMLLTWGLEGRCEAPIPPAQSVSAPLEGRTPSAGAGP
jgi:serine-type D-Ala-D-Ala carboxypeptidase (penicillin-binding protein 5/6)